jgi:hypothetical protein
MMSENIAQNMKRTQGIINYPLQLHLVGHFLIMYSDKLNVITLTIQQNVRQQRDIINLDEISKTN